MWMKLISVLDIAPRKKKKQYGECKLVLLYRNWSARRCESLDECSKVMVICMDVWCFSHLFISPPSHISFVYLNHGLTISETQQGTCLLRVPIVWHVYIILHEPETFSFTPIYTLVAWKLVYYPLEMCLLAYSTNHTFIPSPEKVQSVQHRGNIKEHHG